MDSKHIVESKFGGRIRVRVCGVLIKNGQYLMANHHGINILGDFWCAPGGGIEFGESSEKALKREFLEETGLQIEVGDFIEFFEVIKPPIHAIEFFYQVKIVGGHLQLGYDPETGNDILKEVKWMCLAEIQSLNSNEMHRYYHKYLQT